MAAIKGLGALTEAERRLLDEARAIYGLPAGDVFAVRSATAVSVLEPAAIVFVTSGGLKLRHPADAATRERLRDLFGAYERDRQGTITGPAPLPRDLTLPAVGRRPE